MAESLLAKLGDLNFTAEEQDAVVVVPESVAIPAEDFACSLVGRVLSPPHLMWPSCSSLSYYLEGRLSTNHHRN
ncbi:hypothetical protein GQ457_02G026500 [Hibiscus cannabinus]